MIQVHIGNPIKPQYAQQVVLTAEFMVGDADGTEYVTLNAHLDDQKALYHVYIAHKLYTTMRDLDIEEHLQTAKAVVEYDDDWFRDLWPYDWDASVYHALQKFSLTYYNADGVPYEVVLTENGAA